MIAKLSRLIASNRVNDVPQNKCASLGFFSIQYIAELDKSNPATNILQNRARGCEPTTLQIYFLNYGDNTRRGLCYTISELNGKEILIGDLVTIFTGTFGFKKLIEPDCYVKFICF